LSRPTFQIFSSGFFPKSFRSYFSYSSSFAFPYAFYNNLLYIGKSLAGIFFFLL